MANTAFNGQMEALPTFLRDRLAELATAIFASVVSYWFAARSEASGRIDPK